MHTTSFPSVQEQPSGASHLRLVESQDYRPFDCSPLDFPVGPSLKSRRQSVLLAGTDDQRRAVIRSELSVSLSAQTRFIEASVAWEVLKQAPSSRMVVLLGDLQDISAASLTRLLGRRHPGLPVLTLDQSTTSVGCSEDAHPAGSLIGAI